MFIPKGQAIHENLATRYLLIDALVDELCESGFSGVVEITLPDSHNHIFLDQGNLAAVIEQSGASGFSKTTISSLATRARAQRGTVSIYSYPAGVAGSIAGRLAAEPLYTHLSTDFADLEKLVLKLLRENDREWFVEVFSGGSHTLIHIADEHYGILSPETLTDEILHPATAKPDSALRGLVQKCQHLGGTFDVFFRPAQRDRESAVEGEPLEAIDDPGVDENILESNNPIEEVLSPPTPFAETRSATAAPEDAKAKNLPETVTETPVAHKTALAGEIKSSSHPIELQDDGLTFPEAMPKNLADAPFTELEARDLTRGSGDGASLEPANEAALTSEAPLTSEAGLTSEAARPQLSTIATVTDPDLADPQPRILPTRELMALPGDFEGMQDALKMADIRRLMGKIIKTIEEVNRGTEQKDNFQMHLRAGQLKVANDYPFLDPFGSEFEYLDGEVVFIGKVEPQAFIGGLTDALIFAVTEAAQASAQPRRLRAYIAEELENLLDRNRDELARYDLVAAIRRIIGPQMS